MVHIIPEHIDKLKSIESEVNYDLPPPAGQESFVVINRKSPVLLSAPHGAKTFRNSSNQIWHEEDEYTAGIALLLGELCDVSVIATTYKNKDFDPNKSTDDVPYKAQIKSLIENSNVLYVIDIHGAALHSTVLDEFQTIDLGYRGQGDQERSIEVRHILALEDFLRDFDDNVDPTCFSVDHNHFSARKDYTITSFVHNYSKNRPDKYIQALQIEMKPQVRVAERFRTATLYKSCGPFAADPNCVMHLIQALSNFIYYLKVFDSKDSI